MVPVCLTAALTHGEAIRVAVGAGYELDGRPVAALGVDQPRLFTRWQRQLRSAEPALR